MKSVRVWNNNMVVTKSAKRDNGQNYTWNSQKAMSGFWSLPKLSSLLRQSRCSTGWVPTWLKLTRWPMEWRMEKKRAVMAQILWNTMFESSGMYWLNPVSFSLVIRFLTN